MNLGNNIKCCHIAMAIWIVALVPLGFAESYPNRPTTAEMAEIVDLGTECVRGVNERCWATQYQTNPVAYRVAPFTNATFYLDQNFMGALASKIRSLVPYYVNPATVYNGTTNIVMLTTNGLWVTLQIGDQINKFTCIPAIGTNAATYGDNPWRIYVANLQERYKVLNALKMNRFTDKITYTNCEYKFINPQGTTYSDSVTKFAIASWVPANPIYGIYAVMDNIDQTWNQQRSRGQHLILGGYTTNVPIAKLEAYCYLAGFTYWWGTDAIVPGTSNTYVKIKEILNPTPSVFPYVDSNIYGDSDSPIGPNPGYPGEWVYGWNLGSSSGSAGARAVFLDWQFNYCTSPLE